ncbi:MAG: helix-turn-helix transcriptional regulator [Thermodesulfobacteriaceae bacterium]|jgi:DNA-binding CsgD family transcriptional regulator
MPKKGVNSPKKQKDRFAIGKAFFQAFPGLIALLDEKGTIIQVNRAWIDKGLKSGLFFRPDTIGYNYLELCERAKDAGDESARKVLEGLKEVLDKRSEVFSMQYSLNIEGVLQPYLLTIFPLPTKPRLIAVVHQEMPKDYSIMSGLAQGTEKKEVSTSENLSKEFKFYALLENKIIPFFRLIMPHLPSELKSTLLDLEREVKEALFEEGKKYHPLSGLSLREAQVALLVKEGKSSEEIAKVLGLSKSAVDFYRKRLRKKFGLKGKKERLSEYLKKYESLTKL